jgi:sphinganine-1-phosphate aldolase
LLQALTAGLSRDESKDEHRVIGEAETDIFVRSHLLYTKKEALHGKQRKRLDSLGIYIPYKDRYEAYTRIPIQGRDQQAVYRELKDIAEEEDKKWETGMVSGTMYHGGKEHYAFLNRVFSLYSYVNLIQRDICPSGTKFESEIIAMVAKMLHGEAAQESNPDDDVCGTVTSGGSESIYNAMFVYREWARKEKGITQPEMVVRRPHLHPAFFKAGHYMGIKLVPVPVKEHFEADVQAMRARISENTIAIAGSAGSISRME